MALLGAKQSGRSAAYGRGEHMDNNVLVALLALAGTAIGSIGGVLTSARLTNYRLQQLEKKVEAHNSLIARTYELESWRDVCEEKFKVANHRLQDLEKAKMGR